jgi:hypothetical protein
MQNGRCRFHGGTTPVGLANPSFRHGGYSEYVPTAMRDSYAHFRSDPEILSLAREIAHHRAQVDLLRRQLDEEQGGGVGLQTAWRDFKRAHRTGRADQMADALTRLDEAMTHVNREERLRSELRKETELLQKLTRSENDRMEGLHMMLSREQALAFMHALAVAVKDSVEKHVIDSGAKVQVLRSVGARFAELSDRRGAEGGQSRGGPAHALDPADRD